VNKCAHLNATFWPRPARILFWSGNHRGSLRMQWKFFCAQHFMHVFPIYKSFLFACLHLACLLPSVCLVLDVVGYVAYT